LDAKLSGINFLLAGTYYSLANKNIPDICYSQLLDGSDTVLGFASPAVIPIQHIALAQPPNPSTYHPTVPRRTDDGN